MFKSVFTRYITAFTAIIAISFLLLTLIISAMLNSYSIESKELLMKNAAQSTGEIISFFCDYLADADFDEAMERYHDRILTSVKTNAVYAGAQIYVTDNQGNVIITSDEAPPERFGSEALAQMTNSSSQYLLSTLGVFEEKQINCIKLVSNVDGSLDGIIIVSSLSIGESNLTSRMTSIIVAASLWVFLAALLAVYNVSRKISEPLNEISEAARSFSVGDLSVRVAVKGKDEIAELATAFNSMADSLEQLERLRSTFIANVSHDLRTPMTTISGFIDGIIDGTIPPEKHSHYLSVISAETRRLSRLINSLLTVSKLESGEQKLAPSIYNLTEQARQILISFETKINEKHIDIDFNGSPDDVTVYADRDAMHQVLYNIIDNAIKFTNEGGKITLTVDRTAPVAGITKRRKAIVTVRNTGEGISSEDLPFVFERFYKTDRSRGLDKTGVGLGLYIVKQIVKRHGEDITVDSVAGEFCEFSWTVPLPDSRKTDFTDRS